MTKIENEIQYAWAEQRVEELLPLVNDNTPADIRLTAYSESGLFP